MFTLHAVVGAKNTAATICRNSLRAIFCIGEIAWKNLYVTIVVPARSTKTHHLSNNQNASAKNTQEIIDFLYNLAKQEGESYATRYVRFLTGTGVRDSEKGYVQLPSSFSKRQIYKNFCFKNGWIATSDSNGNYNHQKDFEKRSHDDELGDMASWPTGSLPQKVCAYSTFFRIWSDYLPFITIRPPSLDTCMQCHIFRNQSKYKKCVELFGVPQNETIPSAQSSTCTPVIITDIPNKAKRADMLQRLMENEDETEEFRETMVLAAAKHIKEAQAQKHLAAKKIDLSQNSGTGENKIVTLVIDYCQNLDLPHVGQDQPGDSYYFSPVWLYCLGIVDASTNRLYA